jgi:tetratricopeptide (TPR) repeat protein
MKDPRKLMIASWDRKISSDPNNGQALLERGTLLLTGDAAERELGVVDLGRAIAMFTTQIGESPRDAEAYLGRARAHFQLGNFNASIDDATKLIEIDPRRREAYRLRGWAKIRLGEGAQSDLMMSRRGEGVSVVDVGGDKLEIIRRDAKGRERTTIIKLPKPSLRDSGKQTSDEAKSETEVHRPNRGPAFDQLSDDGVTSSETKKKESGSNPAAGGEMQDAGAQNEDELLEAYLVAARVSPGRRASAAAKIRQAVALARAQERPKWDDRHEFEDLKYLPALVFLKRVHASEIGPDKTVHKEWIRAIDASLMSAIESYISKRTGRGNDLGDAEDLVFVASRPARNKVSREVTHRKKGTVLTEAKREGSKKYAKAKRARQPS